MPIYAVGSHIEPRQYQPSPALKSGSSRETVTHGTSPPSLSGRRANSAMRLAWAFDGISASIGQKEAGVRMPVVRHADGDVWTSATEAVSPEGAGTMS